MSVALVRALFALSGRESTPEDVNPLAYELESLAHGSPSGVDNTVIAYEMPLRFQHGAGTKPVLPGGVFHLQLVDSGERAATKEIVAGVRQRRDREPQRFRSIFSAITALVDRAEEALVTADARSLGALCDENHELLRVMGVSTPRLDSICTEAKRAGALGAKVTGEGAAVMR